ncbi:hypothetical protein APHAL10511_002497 [Amanita phalloides]|nr:hypothetical protein APHAL10511_002497 [Amanita phalloides]
MTRLLLLLHSLFAIAAFRTPPPNVFTALAIPLNSPTDTIRARLALPDILLQRLENPQLRALYVRFGHNVLLTCEHCQTYTDYALYAIPRPALAYLREIAFVGLITLDRRPLGVGILAAAFVSEAYWLATVPISVPPPNTHLRVEDTYMWHDRLLIYRRSLFFALPIFLSLLTSIQLLLAHIPILSMFVPRPLPLVSLSSIHLDPLTAHNMPPARLRSLLIQSSLNTLDHLLHAVRLERFTQAALMRDPTLRGRACEWWDTQKEEADIILRDEGVKKAARAEGLAFEEKKEEDDDDSEGLVRTKARTAVDNLFRRGFPPSQHWVQQ